MNKTLQEARTAAEIVQALDDIIENSLTKAGVDVTYMNLHNNEILEMKVSLLALEVQHQKNLVELATQDAQQAHKHFTDICNLVKNTK
jgi:hypothetical protein